MDEIERALNDWKKRIDKKTEEIISHTDKAAMKAALFCEGEAKKNIMSQVYSTPSETYIRTGLLKASIHSGMSLDKAHTATIYSDAPYAKYVEFGTGRAGSESDAYRPFDGGYNLNWRGMHARPFMYPAVFHNKEKIKQIISTYLKENVRW